MLDWRPLRAFRKYKAVSLRRKHSGNSKADCVVNNRAAGQKYEKYSDKRGQRTVKVESSDRCIVEGALQKSNRTNDVALSLEGTRLKYRGDYILYS